MGIIETKADKLMAAIDKHKILTVKDAALELGVTEDYVRKLAIVLQKSKLIDLKANMFALTMISKQEP